MNVQCGLGRVVLGDVFDWELRGCTLCMALVWRDIDNVFVYKYIGGASLELFALGVG